MRLYRLEIFLVVLIVCSSLVGAENYWQQRVGYSIDARLDTTDHTVTGSELVTYNNQSPDTLQEIYFHLYPNAFRNDTTAAALLMKKNYQSPPRSPYQSRMEIGSFTVHLGNLQSSEYSVYGTELRASLSGLLVPGASLTVEIQFTNHLHKSLPDYRGGYAGDQYDITQWYPKVAVYDQKGWHVRQWDFYGEYYGEFGTFDVSLDLPANFIVGATGVVIKGDPGWEEVQYDTTREFGNWFGDYYEAHSQRTYLKSQRRETTFHAENVHDFAWSASPDFIYEHGKFNDVDINVLYRNDHAWQWHRKTVEQGYNALEWLDSKFGTYLYPQITIIDGLLSGGMEYPMLVMDGSANEDLVVHEIGHNYFYGILANDETEDAWMDEGFTTFQENQYFQQKYPKDGWRPEQLRWRYPGYLKMFPHVSARVDLQNRIIRSQLSGMDESVAKPEYRFSSESAYYLVVYDKAALMLDMLEYVMGKPAFWKGMREYYKTWQLKHVNESRFREVMQAQTDTDLEWFFNEWLHQTGYVDYALDSVRKTSLGKDSLTVQVQIRNRGKFTMPVTVELQTKDGQSQRKLWFSSDRSGSVVFHTHSAVQRVILDPDNQILDVNYLNNYSGIPKYTWLPNIPGLQYHPRDAFVVRYGVTLWYNSPDGLRPGLKLDRSYLGNRRRLILGIWYGSKSGQVDYDVSYENRLYRISPQLRYRLRSASIEGRQWNEIQLSDRWERGWNLLPETEIQAGFRNIALVDSSYLYSPRERGVINQLYGKIRYQFRGIDWHSSVSGEYITSQKFLYSDFNFNTISLEWQYRDSRLKPFTIFGRLFGGIALFNSEIPVQQRFSVADGGQYASFNHFYSRSRGSFFGLSNAHNYVYIPGDGNVRGYHSSRIAGGDNIVAANLEIRKDAGQWFPIQGVTFAAFTDMAYAGLNLSLDYTIDKKDFFADAGVGISLEKRILQIPFYTRVDFPFWINQPEYMGSGEKSFGLRFRVSFERLF